MKSRFLLVCCLLLLSGSVWAQGEAELARKTEALLDTLYAKAGPELGCLLYEPAMTLVLAGLIPSQSADPTNPLSSDTMGRLPEVNNLLQAHQARLALSTGSRYMTLESLSGLQRQTALSKLSWVQPFDAKQGWDGYDQWKESQRNALEASGGGQAGRLLYGFMRGQPDSSIRAEELAASSPAEKKRQIRTQLPYSQHLAGGLTNFTILPEDASAADVGATMASWVTFWEALYTAPAVRARLADPSFLKARRELVSKLHTQRSERWIRAEDLRFALAEVNNCEVTLEKALIEHQVALVALVESGATPEEWQRGFLRLTAKDQLLAVPDSQRWEQWIWYGAFPGSSTRNALYKTVKEKRPEFLRALAEYYVESWKAEAVKPEPNAENAIVLFEHPEVQAYYLSLDVAAQDEVLELLRGMSFDIGIRGLLAAPPYAR